MTGLNDRVCWGWPTYSLLWYKNSKVSSACLVAGKAWNPPVTSQGGTQLQIYVRTAKTIYKTKKTEIIVERKSVRCFSSNQYVKMLRSYSLYVLSSFVRPSQFTRNGAVYKKGDEWSRVRWRICPYLVFFRESHFFCFFYTFERFTLWH